MRFNDDWMRLVIKRKKRMQSVWRRLWWSESHEIMMEVHILRGCFKAIVLLINFNGSSKIIQMKSCLSSTPYIFCFVFNFNANLNRNVMSACTYCLK